MRRDAPLLLMVVACAVGLTPAAAQDRPPAAPATLDAKHRQFDAMLAASRGRMVRRQVVARCPECRELAAAVNVLGQRHADLFERIFALRDEDAQLARELGDADEAFRAASARGDGAAADRLRARLADIVSRRAGISRALGAARDEFADVGLQLVTRRDELDQCEAKCFPPERQDRTATDPGPVPSSPDVAITPIGNARGASCPECQAIADRLAGARAAQARAVEHQARLFAQVEALDRQISDIETEHLQVELRMALRSSNALSQRLADLDAAWRAAGARADALRREYERLTPVVSDLTRQMLDLEGLLRSCNVNSCPKAQPAAGQTAVGGAGTAGTHLADGCSTCRDVPPRIKEVERELADLRERINSIQENQEALEGLREKAAGNARYVEAFDGQLQQLNRRHAEAVRDEQEKTKELEGLHDRLKKCGTSCAPDPPKKTSMNPKIIGGLGAAGALVAVLAGGGGEATASAAGSPIVTAPPRRRRRRPRRSRPRRRRAPPPTAAIAASPSSSCPTPAGTTRPSTSVRS